MIKLVLTDMDYTLTCPERMQVSDKALAAIHRLQELGVRFGPASGRDQRDLTNMFRGHTECFATGLMSNGKKVFVDGKLIHRVVLDRPALEHLMAALRTMPGTWLITRSPHGDKACGISPQDFSKTSWSADPAIKPLPGLPEWELSTAGIMWDPDDPAVDGEAVHALAEEAAPEFHYLSPAPGMLHVLPAGWTKASGVRILQEALGLEADEICAFGDSDNDLAMMEYLPNATAVANANKAVTRASRWHIGSTFDDAVADALAELARAAESGGVPSFMRAAGGDQMHACTTS